MTARSAQRCPRSTPRGCAWTGRSNLMMICGVLIFGRAASRSRGCASVIDERFLRVHALPPAPGARCPACAFWESDAALRHRRPRRRAWRCRAARARRSCRRSCRGSQPTPLDPARPLWQFHLVDNFEGGSALIARIHHCYADGIALVRVMLSMTDAAPNGPPAMPFEPRRSASAPTPTIRSAQLLAPLSGVHEAARKVGATLIEKGAAIWDDPAQGRRAGRAGRRRSPRRSRSSR